jgi:DNA adenine methylase
VFFNIQKKQSFLSDVNAELINTYQVIKNKPKLLIKFLKTCEYSAYFYEKIRAWDRSENWQEKFSDVERA